MLVLIAGITGMVGKPCAEAALARGHAVRGLGRSPDKLGQDLLTRLEGFEKSTGIYDLAALERAVAGVDAVICAYGFDPELVVEGQLLLLRAAERAGVKIFHAASWNYDWSRGYLGQHESYDPYIVFAAHVRVSSNIKPIYMFTGAIADFIFYDERDKIWNKETKTFHYFGDKTQALRYTTADDIAAYTSEAIQAPGAENGGYVRVQSFAVSPADVVAAYEAAHGRKAHAQCVGSIEDAERMLAKARATTSPVAHDEYIGLSYAVHMARGSWEYEPSDGARFPTVKPTDLKSWLLAHPDL
ncbi:NmrA-like family protein [Macrophomina phaseolina]|uniref:NmrA-like family protein n=1 Tax=Macrophomina phaseolina TaxID=35725 RepID=A0ABQ8GZ23_9PEZI|nr:NmrA-like family protein [Macrophomina phaseolina]